MCLLMIIGVRTDGRKELVVLADGFHESVESWADLLRDCKRRGMPSAIPVFVGPVPRLLQHGPCRHWPAHREHR